MEKTIIDAIKKNNNNVKIIFVLTHSLTNPYTIENIKNRKLKETKNFLR